MILIANNNKTIEIENCFDEDTELSITIRREFGDDILMWLDVDQVKLLAKRLTDVLKTVS